MQKKYRPNAGIVVFRKDKKVLVCARADRQTNNWQFPQGGIDNGETPAEAAVRELSEETGITSAKLVYTTPSPIRYDFPNHVLKHFEENGRDFYGQDQYWSLFYFDGNDSEINFYTHPEEIEFKAFQWIDIEQAPELIVFFKKEAYAKMVSIFKPIIEKFQPDI
ncbi:MAG: RNA pyrophosphohydrolase [Alphaproteobacteria bacterium]|nr:RNA pyrophosphohydrolase [Alphaproteobacteria bacterium]